MRRFAAEVLTCGVLLGCSTSGRSISNASDAGAGDASVPNFDPSTGVTGNACVLAIEDDPKFYGFLDIETTHDQPVGINPACPGEICVVHEFQGRASCPYGQTTEALSLSSTDPRRCRTPSGAPVEDWIAPQLVDRPASRYSICSCRCSLGGEAGDNSNYCTCPTGMVCRALIPNLLPVDAAWVGAYCVWEDENPPSATTCSIDSTDPATLCGASRRNP